MSVDELMEKAKRLFRSGRVTQLDGDRFNVAGNHGTYLVQVLIDGRVTCNCTGFQNRKMCSHAIAVILMRKQRV